MMGPGVIVPVAVAAAVGGFIAMQRSRGAAPGSDVRRLIRIAGSDDHAKAKEAIRALGRTHSDEALEYLLGRAGSTYSANWYTSATMEALGEMSHERGIKRLLEIVASGSVAEPDARAGLELVRGDAAVPALLHFALQTDDYHAVKFAIRTLERLGTPVALLALDEFRAHPARTVIRRELETGRIPESTTIFGQRR